MDADGNHAASERFPFIAADAGLPKDAQQQPATDVLRVGIRYPELSSAPLHLLVVASGHGRLEAQRAKASDQVLALDWTNRGHSGDFANLDAVAAEVRNRGAIGNADQHPSLQDALQLIPASFQGFGICPDARDRWDMAIVRPVILDSSGPSPVHRDTTASGVQ